jgi:hypothetical protein
MEEEYNLALLKSGFNDDQKRLVNETFKSTNASLVNLGINILSVYIDMEFLPQIDLFYQCRKDNYNIYMSIAVDGTHIVDECPEQVIMSLYVSGKGIPGFSGTMEGAINFLKNKIC